MTAWGKDRYKFLKGGLDQGFSQNYSDDVKMRLFACCVVSQQEAGFGSTIDLRETKCPRCDASGFNTGWGYWAFTCGAEILSDGTKSKSCEPSKSAVTSHDSGGRP